MTEERHQHDPETGRKARVLAIVPALNEAGNVSAVVREALALPEPPDVVVVDDGSTDDTAAMARRAGATVLVMPFNVGIGAAVQAGVLLALETGYDRVVRFDGDGQHDPSTVAALLAPIDEGEADFVVGSRYLEPSGFRSTWARRLGAKWFSWLLRALAGVRVTDPTSGLWAANRRAAEVLFHEHSPDYPEVDSLVHLAMSGCRVAERPARMRPRASGRSSIGLFDSAYYLFKVTLALMMGRVRGASRGPSGEESWNSRRTKASRS